jgi:hypothetical protein
MPEEMRNKKFVIVVIWILVILVIVGLVFPLISYLFESGAEY